MRTEVRIPAAGATLAGWLYLPDTAKPRHSLVVMSHGFSALKGMGLDEYASSFAQAEIACLVYDHRSFGASDGEPRQEVDPWQQVHDMRDAISYARSLPQVDPERIGVWGTSYAGSHALVVGAIDRRLRCVVAQVPLIQRIPYPATLGASGQTGLPPGRFQAGPRRPCAGRTTPLRSRHS